MTSEAPHSAMSKSANKHNRITGTGLPLHADLPELIEKDEISESQDPKLRAKRLVEEFDW